MAQAQQHSARTGTRSTGPVPESAEHIKKSGPPVELLPLNFVQGISVEKMPKKFMGAYHFSGTTPPVTKTFFRDIQDRAFCIVACTSVTTDSVPARFDPLLENVTSNNTGVPSPWVSKCSKFVLYPDEENVDIIDFATTPVKDIVKGGWMLPKRSFREHFIVPAHRDKFFYKNPCSHEEFIDSASKMKSYKKYTDSEASDVATSRRRVPNAPIVVPSLPVPDSSTNETGKNHFFLNSSNPN
jgi:hypothetical protein